MNRQLISTVVLTAALAAGPAVAAEVAPNVPSCLPAGGNGVVSATLTPATGWSNVRVYFRAAGTDAYYFLEMRSDGSGGYWATLPKPAPGTDSVDVYLLAVPADGSGTRTAEAAVPVLSSCSPALTPDQRSYADNLVVGETAAGQQGQPVVGFECDGIVSRIAANGELKPDEACRKVMLARAEEGAAASHHKWLVPVVVLGTAGAGVVLSHNDNPNPSPSTPQ